MICVYRMLKMSNYEHFDDGDCDYLYVNIRI